MLSCRHQRLTGLLQACHDLHLERWVRGPFIWLLLHGQLLLHPLLLLRLLLQPLLLHPLLLHPLLLHPLLLHPWLLLPLHHCVEGRPVARQEGLQIRPT